MKTKKCTKCGEEKPATREFFQMNQGRLRSQCKMCISERRKQYYKSNREAILEKRKQYRQDNREAISERHKQWWHSNREEILERRKQHYKSNREAILEQNKQYRLAKNIKQPACIYQIVNNKNGQIYVGETVQGILRWKKHLAYLRGGYHPNENLQEDFNKFGEEAFEWSIVKRLPKDKDLLIREEKLHIDGLISEGKKLYNIYLNS